MVLGCDAAGTGPDGREVVVHAVVNDPDFVGSDATYARDGRCCPSAIPGRWPSGWVPAATWSTSRGAELRRAACLPTAWLTAYRMLFTSAAPGPGTPFWSGAGGGCPRRWCARPRAGLRMWVTSRQENGRAGRRARRTPRVRRGERCPNGWTRGDGDRRRGHLVALVTPCARAARWSQRHHIRGRAGPGRADQDLLPAAPGDGSTMAPATSWSPHPNAVHHRRPAGDRPGDPARPGGRLAGALIAGDVFGKVVVEP